MLLKPKQPSLKCGLCTSVTSQSLHPSCPFMISDVEYLEQILTQFLLHWQVYIKPNPLMSELTNLNAALKTADKPSHLSRIVQAFECIIITAPVTVHSYVFMRQSVALVYERRRHRSPPPPLISQVCPFLMQTSPIFSHTHIHTQGTNI